MASAAVLTPRKKQDTSGALPPLVSLKCDICEKYLSHPVTLPCLHSFCSACLESYNKQRIAKLTKQKINEIRERGESVDSQDFSLNPGSESPTVQCPTCIEVLGLSPVEEPQLPFENSRLARIVGLVHDSNVLCQNCSEKTSEVKCETCSSWLCIDCESQTHNAPIFKKHARTPLSHNEMMALPKCEAHPQNDLEFFSTEEEVGVCQVCLLKGDYVGKPYCLVSDIRKARQYEIERGVKAIIEEKEKLLQGKQKMEATLEQLDRKLEVQKELVSNNFAQIREALDRREKETLQALDGLKVAKADVLTQQMMQSEHILDVINDGVRNVKLVLSHSNDLELVYLTIVLQEFVADLGKSDTTRFKKAGYPLKHYHTPAVDASLPVSLSDRVAELVSAYAPVPEVKVSQGKQSKSVTVQNGESGNRSEKVVTMKSPKVTDKQREILKDIGAEGKAEENGCSIQ